MMKIIKAEYKQDYVIQVVFSDGCEGAYDLYPLIVRKTTLTTPLLNHDYFCRFFLELGALCWPNGLELSPSSIYRALLERGLLIHPTQAA